MSFHRESRRASLLLLGLVIGCSDADAPMQEPPAAETPPPLPLARPPGFAMCYSSLAESHPASQQFWQTFSAEDTKGRPAAIAALNKAVKQYPDEEELVLLDGLANLWRLAAPTDAEAKDSLGFMLAALAAKNQLEHAYTLCPTDYRVPAWLGPVLINMGRGSMDQPTLDKGMAVLQDGIAHYPSFVLFSQLLIYADRPRDDPDFQKALDAVDKNTAVCAMPTQSIDPACTNSAKVLHNREGSAVFLGDIYAKAGRRADALNAYDRAKTVPEYATWPFQTLLQDRIANVDARMKAYGDTDPKNDPDSAWTARYQCAICHQR